MLSNPTYLRPEAAIDRLRNWGVTILVTLTAGFCLIAPSAQARNAAPTTNQVLNSLKNISHYATQLEEDSLYQEIQVLVRDLQRLASPESPRTPRNIYLLKSKRRALIQRLETFSNKYGEEFGSLKTSYDVLSGWILATYSQAPVEKKLAFLRPRQTLLQELGTGRIHENFRLPLDQAREFLHEVQPYILVHLQRFSRKLTSDGLYRLMEEEVRNQLQNQKSGQPVDWAQLDGYIQKIEKRYPQIRAFELMLSQVYRNQVVSYFSEVPFRGLPKVVWTEGSKLAFFDWRKSIEDAFALVRINQYTPFAMNASRFSTDRLRSLKQTPVAGL